MPVIIKTSLNLKGEPIVATPENAHLTFSKSGLDSPLLGPHLSAK